jgi:hypothetical protein
VAKGYTQKKGEDFFVTYSPVAQIAIIRVLLALAASYGLHVHQIDVKTAFLWRVRGRDIYSATGWLCCPWRGEQNKIPIWPKAST